VPLLFFHICAGGVVLLSGGVAWWAAWRRDGETGIFDWAGLMVAFSVGAALKVMAAYMRGSKLFLVPPLLRLMLIY
jgi:hypothetical protein